MDRRLRPVRKRTFLVLAAALLAAGPWVGWWTLAPLLVAVALFQIAETKIANAVRPEYWMFAAWTGAELVIALSVALTGSSAVSMLVLLTIPIVTLSARFSSRGIWVGVGIAAGLIVTVALYGNADVVAHDPPRLIAPLAVVVAAAMLSMALMHSDVEHRDKAIIDQLTGLLNRAALDTRVNELEQQSAITREPVGVIVADLDGFKAINDSYGHAMGDRVLMDVAYLLRKCLRAFDLAYRLGGDEFVILVPGAELEVARAVAESARGAVEIEELGPGVWVSLSCGVSTSHRGEPFSYDETFARANAALDESKERALGVAVAPVGQTEVLGGSKS
jgi:diguanylate cyclase (GGDEF)-like protein